MSNKIIRKLNVGSIKEGFYWLVGNTQMIDGVKKTISAIKEKLSSIGERSWEVWVSETDDDGHTVHHCWKEHIKGSESVTIENDINF
jgi:hypothetical protein